MRLKHVPDSVCDISENNFWNAFSASSLRENPKLSGAVAAGLKGRRKQAYQRLGEFHQRILEEEWRVERERFTSTEKDQKHCFPLQTPEDLLKNRINVWANTVIEFGAEIDWNFKQTDQYGFHYLQWLQPGIACLMSTGSADMRKKLSEIVLSYYQNRNLLEHPRSNLHLVYYELGSWAKFRMLFPLYLELLYTGELSTELHEAFMKLFLGFGRSLYRLQKSYRGGNWQIVGCACLLILGNVFPHFRESKSWRARALKYMKAHLKKDFFSDGGHSERCWGYGMMSLKGVCEAYDSAMRYNCLGTDKGFFLRRIRQSFRWFAKSLGPGETPPCYGDGSLGRNKAILDAARKYFPTSVSRFLGVDETASYYLAPSGYVLMRNGEGETPCFLNMNVGWWAGWHSHLDLLNLNIWAFGDPLIEECGRFGGYGEALSTVSRAPESHNQLTIDGMHYDVTPENRRIRDVVWYSDDAIDFVSAWHQAYRSNPYLEPQSIDAMIRRTVVFVKNPGYAVVFDQVREENSNNEGPNMAITQNWHSPYPFKQLDNRTLTVEHEKSCLIRFAREENLRRLERGMDYSQQESNSSGEWPERYYLRARRWMDVEYRGMSGFATLFFPFQKTAPDLGFEPVALKNADPYCADAFEISGPMGTDRIALNPELLPNIKMGRAALDCRALVKLDSKRGSARVE